MATITYQQIQTENLITFSFQSITNNFKTIGSFIKNFQQFQRKFNDLEKMQKAASHDLTNFKMSTANTFSTMNQILDSRGNISKGNNKVVEQQMNEVKKTVKELKAFVTQSTRDINDHLQLKEKQTLQVYKKYDSQFEQLETYHSSDKLRIEALENQVHLIKTKFTTRLDTDIIRQNLKQANMQIATTKQQVKTLSNFLQSLGVKQFKQHLDKIQSQLFTDMKNLKSQFNLKTDVLDILKLQDMLLNIVNFTYQNVAKRYANKNQTKKALVYIQKKVNTLIQSLYSEEEGETKGLLAAKGWKCVSCTKDLGEFQGKLDKYKAWSVFPVKEHTNKEKYSGFGTGFQSIIETAVTKKGGEIGYDQKGRMTTPFNLTRQVQANGSKNQSQSQNKLRLSSPTKAPAQTNYMNLFGRSSEIDINIKAEYAQKQKGLASILKIPSDNKTTK